MTTSHSTKNTEQSLPTKITRFTRENGYGFLSNFHPSTIYIDGKPYPTVEHAIQAHKTLDADAREIIRKAPTPGEAKRLGHSLQLRPDWMAARIPMMREFLRKKFHNPFLRPLLLETGDAVLVNDNSYNDRFWGVCREMGENWLGKLLMEIRDEIRKSQEVE